MESTRHDAPRSDAPGIELARLLTLAEQHCEAGRLMLAEALCRQILAMDSQSSAAEFLLGVIAHWGGRHDVALEHLGRALARGAPRADMHDHMGSAYWALRRLDDALASYHAALRLDPSFAPAHGNLGRLMAAQGRLDDAVPHFEAAARLAPDFAPNQYNLGRALCDQGRLTESVPHFREALRLAPNYLYARNNLGIVLSRLGQLGEALAHLEMALLLDPNDAAAHHNRGMVLLRLGRFAEGWPDYDWRWRTTPAKSPLRDFAQPVWTGEDAGDRVIMLHAEQGFGDTLQFCRYAPLAAKRCAKVYLEVQAALFRLCARSLSNDKLEVVPRAVNFPGHEGLPDFDLHCPVLSLPRVFATTLADVPDETPYLVADPADVAAWSRRLSVLPGLRVGLVWAGNPQYSDDSRRSLWLAQLAPLAMAGVSLVSLQTGAAAHGSHPPAGMTLLDASGDLHDFADTAAAITALDLVISVDTASAHLAGALGKPVWLLNRFDSDWRWLVERDDSPWYPSMRIFRQRAFGDWDSVISAVASALTRLVGGPATTAGDGPHSTAVAPPAPRPAPAVAPKSELALTELGNALREQGRIAEARAAFVAALEANPASTVAYYNLAETQTFLPGDPCFVAMAKLAENSAVLTGTEQAQLEFALAKAHADIGAHARAAEHLLRANAIARARVPYDETSMLGLFGRIRGVFTAEMIERHAGHGDPSTTPVLIVGMPRSGTTLIEQILASHPNVFGAGELMDLPAMIYAVRDAGGAIAHFPEFAGALEPGGLRLFGAAYAKGLRDRAPSAERVTDKLPANFLHVGLVHLALPRARIIHVRRHPLDTCLSCFAKLFANELHFTYDLAELGRYYRAYERLMAHWREVLPSEAMLEVDYEDVVSDAKTQVRRLLAYCGLAWDDACLRYYESRRPVRTASAVQVRQPLFSSSIGRWKAYERMLAPLTRELQRP